MITARAQAPVKTAPDTVPSAPDLSLEPYRLRIENALYGRIEVSLDGGESYLLIGRVQGPASVTIPDPSAQSAGVILRSSGTGLVFSVGAGQSLKVLADTVSTAVVGHLKTAGKGRSSFKTVTAVHARTGALLTDCEVHKALFSDLVPPPGTPVQLQGNGRNVRAIPEAFVPSLDDVFVIIAPPTRAPNPVSIPIPIPTVADVRKRWEACAQEYAANAPARARVLHRTVASGVLTLRARVPEGEPEPVMAVTYSVDGVVLAAHNVLPSIYVWNTRRIANGEHVVEIRALSKTGAVISSVRAVVLVDNGP